MSNKARDISLMDNDEGEVGVYYSQMNGCSLPDCPLQVVSPRGGFRDEEGDFPKVGEVGYVVAFNNNKEGGTIDVCGKCLKRLSDLIHQLNDKE